MEYATLDETRYPIVVFLTHAVIPDDTSMQNFLDANIVLLQKAREKLVILYDLDESRFMSVKHRVKAGNWYNENKALFQEKTHALGIINSSIIGNLILKGIFAITGSDIVTIHSNMDDALKWAEEIFEKHQVK